MVFLNSALSYVHSPPPSTHLHFSSLYLFDTYFSFLLHIPLLLLFSIYWICIRHLIFNFCAHTIITKILDDKESSKFEPKYLFEVLRPCPNIIQVNLYNWYIYFVLNICRSHHVSATARHWCVLLIFSYENQQPSQRLAAFVRNVTENGWSYQYMTV